MTALWNFGLNSVKSTLSKFCRRKWTCFVLFFCVNVSINTLNVLVNMIVVFFFVIKNIFPYISLCIVQSYHKQAVCYSQDEEKKIDFLNTHNNKINCISHEKPLKYKNKITKSRSIKYLNWIWYATFVLIVLVTFSSSTNVFANRTFLLL